MTPHQVLSHYFEGTKQFEVRPLSGGLIHATYKVTTGSETYILQKLHPIFSEAMTSNVDTVSRYLTQHGMMAQQVIRTKHHARTVHDTNAHWRLLSYIEGRVFEQATLKRQAYEAGRIVGTFHHTMKNFHRPLKQQRANANMPQDHYQLFQKRTEHHTLSSEMLKWKKEIDALQDLRLPRLRKTIVHGDTKLTNIIFHPTKIEARALIDIDDVNRHSHALIDLANGMRSWCAKAEDDPQNNLSLARFEAALQGYQQGSKNFLTKKERRYIPIFMRHITLTLASRFFRDILEDTYFAYDKKRYSSRKAHNRARTIGQITLACDILKKTPRMLSIIDSSTSL